MAALFAAVNPTLASTLRVRNCRDSGPGSLRATVAEAAAGDEIDVTRLKCAAVTLSTGAIVVSQGSLTISGPGPDKLAIVGINDDRIFQHDGSGTVSLQGISIGYGKFSLSTGIDPAFGGCIRSYGSVSLDHTIVANCKVMVAQSVLFAAGGCIATPLGRVSMVDSTVTGCTTYGQSMAAGGDGGAIFTDEFYALRSTISNSSTLSKSYDGFGGCVRTGKLTLLYSTVSGCYSPVGGGIHVYGGAALIRASTISDNMATLEGGGALLDTAPYRPQIINSTISGNRSRGYAAGILTGYEPVLIQNSTIASNLAYKHAANVGAGLTVISRNEYGLPIRIESSIIADNFGDGITSDFGADPTAEVSGASNIIQVLSAPVPPGFAMTACPMLGPLRDNGGLTKTRALESHSPAIAAGNNNATLSFDQRGAGYPRLPTGNIAPDVGAYETQDDNLFSVGFDGCGYPQ
jgi:hypothetical protein